MSIETPSVPAGPTAGVEAVTFRFPDPDSRLAGVRLVQDVRVPGDRLQFARTPGGWELTLPRPRVGRMEYRLALEYPDGSREEVCDPGNPRVAPGAFGDKSVVELPDYRPPAWLHDAVVESRTTELAVPSATCAPRCRSGSGPCTTRTRPSRCRCWSPTTARSTPRCPA